VEEDYSDLDDMDLDDIPTDREKATHTELWYFSHSKLYVYNLKIFNQRIYDIGLFGVHFKDQDGFGFSLTIMFAIECLQTKLA
jgi:hypothetical protein